MKRVELLINEVRELTGDQRSDASTGPSQYVMVRALKNAQIELYKLIANCKEKTFSKEKIIPVVPNAERYDYPDDMFLQNVVNLQWRNNPGGNVDFINLYQLDSRDRVTTLNGYPFGYMRRGDGILTIPPLATGSLRLTYIKRIPDLEKRSGKISSVTVSNGSVTAMTLDASESSFDAKYINDLQAICIVDRYGKSKALNLEIMSVDPGTGVITFPTPQSLGDGSVSVGDYVTAGFWTYNLSEMPDVCENYFIKYATYQIRYGDASNWTKEAVNDLAMTAESAVESFKDPQHDITEVLITNTDYMDLF